MHVEGASSWPWSGIFGLLPWKTFNFYGFLNWYLQLVSGIKHFLESPVICWTSWKTYRKQSKTNTSGFIFFVYGRFRSAFNETERNLPAPLVIFIITVAYKLGLDLVF